MEIEQADRIAYLLSRHITDTLSSEEHTELERWLALDIKNQELWRKVCRRGFYSEKEMLQYCQMPYQLKNLFSIRKLGNA